jgi:hypothetical protein
MRGGDVRTEGLLSYVSCERRVPPDHPLRRILPIVDAALRDLLRCGGFRRHPAGAEHHAAPRPEHLRPALGDRPPHHPPPRLCPQPAPPKRIEETFGWIKTCGGLRKTRHRGTGRVGWMFPLTAAACNLIRLPKLLARA